MKRNATRTNFYRFILRNFVALTSILLVFNLYAMAQQPVHHANFKHGSISYMGTAGDGILFNIKLHNSSGSRIGILILDHDGEKLFSGFFKDKTIDKNFKIPASTGVLTFIVSNAADKTQQQIKVSTERRYVEDLSVTRLK